MKKRRGVESRLVKGRGGVFEVVLDGRLLFSKTQQGRFPDHAEIVNQIPENGTG